MSLARWVGLGFFLLTPWLPAADSADRAAWERSLMELRVGRDLLDAKFKFLHWAGQDLDAQEPVRQEYNNTVEKLADDLQQGGESATRLSNRATNLMWRLFRETKPMLDARPGQMTDMKKRYEIVEPIVRLSLEMARVKYRNTMETGQGTGDLKALIDFSVEKLALAQKLAGEGNYRSAMRSLSEAVPSTDKVIVGLPRNSAGIKDFQFNAGRD